MEITDSNEIDILRERIDDLENQLIESSEQNELLKDQLNESSDTCKKCGCNEFLCGHNKRG